jgi:hypothetical protein
MVLVTYRHGLRASEVCDLQWHQVELDSSLSAADPPAGGDIWILKITHAPSPKNLSKNGFCPRKGVAFLRKAFLQKKFSGAGEDSAVGACVRQQLRACAEAFKEASASQ